MSTLWLVLSYSLFILFAFLVTRSCPCCDYLSGDYDIMKLVRIEACIVIGMANVTISLYRIMLSRHHCATGCYCISLP